MKYLILYLAVINAFAFSLFGIDKKRAQNRQWRIPEKYLLFFAALGGALGAFIGMYFFRHKTKKWKFRVLIPLFLALYYLLFVRFL